MSKSVYVLRTCAADMSSSHGFTWPESGPVEALDWSPEAQCGGGLHGLLWGQGDGGLLSWGGGAKWLVVEVDAATIVDLDGKVKFPRGEVVYCGDRYSATEFIIARGADRNRCVGAVSTAGDGGTATAGYGGTATAGDGGTATAGDGGTVIVRWWDPSALRYRAACGDVGDEGIEPGVAYEVKGGKLVPAVKP